MLKFWCLDADSLTRSVWFCFNRFVDRLLVHPARLLRESPVRYGRRCATMFGLSGALFVSFQDYHSNARADQARLSQQREIKNTVHSRTLYLVNRLFLRKYCNTSNLLMLLQWRIAILYHRGVFAFPSVALTGSHPAPSAVVLECSSLRWPWHSTS